MNRTKELVELVCVLAIIVACHVVKKTNSIMLPPFDKEGHRGCRGLMPENTIPAMLKAVDLGVTTLEMDAVITKDKKVIVSHEPWLGHEITTKPDGSYIEAKEERNYNIYQMTYDEVKQFDVGLKPNPRFPRQQKIKAVKPLLTELIDSVESYLEQKKLPEVFYNIETKCQPTGDNLFHPQPNEFIELLITAIKEKGIEERVIIQSFDFRTLQYLHQKYPLIKTAMLIEDFDKRSMEAQLKALGFAPTIYSPHYSLVDEMLIEKCHQQNIKVIPWTVNDKALLERLKKLGVDGIISDYPDLFSSNP